jgi:MFS transporter, DHA1 family, multidrug resistance protein
MNEVLRSRLFVGYMLTAALSGFTMMAYIANSSYVLQEIKGIAPLPFALFFASTALAQILLSILNAKIVGRRFAPRTLIGFGLALATLAVAALTVGVVLLGIPLILTCAGFLVLMAVQAFIFGNANALAAPGPRTSPVPPPPSSASPKRWPWRPPPRSPAPAVPPPQSP